MSYPAHTKGTIDLQRPHLTAYWYCCTWYITSMPGIRPEGAAGSGLAEGEPSLKDERATALTITACRIHLCCLVKGRCTPRFSVQYITRRFTAQQGILQHARCLLLLVLLRIHAFTSSHVADHSIVVILVATMYLSSQTRYAIFGVYTILHQ